MQWSSVIAKFACKLLGHPASTGWPWCSRCGALLKR